MFAFIPFVPDTDLMLLVVGPACYYIGKAVGRSRRRLGA